MLKFSNFIVESADSLNITAYHGSGKLFKKFEQSAARVINDFYGGGVAYFTDNKEVGRTYARSMAKTAKTGTPYIYTVSLKFSKMFDVDDVFTGKDLVNILPEDKESFARGAGLLNWKSDKYKVLGDLSVGAMKLSGDSVFKGLSSGMNQTAKTREHLISLGYDGLRYNGGVNMGMATKHNVYLAYKATGIKIEKIALVDGKKK